MSDRPTFARHEQPNLPEVPYGDEQMRMEMALTEISDLFTEECRPSVKNILGASLLLFATKGYHATTTRGISNLAHLSNAGLYFYFSSKNALFNTIVKAAHERLLHLLVQAKAEAEGNKGSSPSRLVLGELLYTHVIFNAKHSLVGRVSNYDVGGLTIEQRRDILLMRRAIEGFFRSAIEEGIVAGEFRIRDSRLTATVLSSLGVDVSRWFSPLGRLSVHDLGDAYRDIGLSIVGQAAYEKSG